MHLSELKDLHVSALISMAEELEIENANRMRKLIKSFPEAETVISQHGRPDDGTDSTGFFNAEFFVPLKPLDRWRKGVDKDALIAEINDALQKAFPGVEFTFSQYIQDNVEEAVSGVRGQVVLSLHHASGRLVNAGALQLPGVLDDVYAAATGARLGLSWRDGTPILRLWAPTARDVRLAQRINELL